MEKLITISAILLVLATLTMSLHSLAELNDGRVNTVVNQLVK